MQSLEEVETIRGRDRDLLAQVKRTIQEILPSATVVLYGSCARGRQGPESDYDLYVIAEGPLSTQEEEEVWDAVFQLEIRWTAVISVQFCSRAEWERHGAMPFHIEVQRDGIIL